MKLGLALAPRSSFPLDFTAVGEGGIDQLAIVSHLPRAEGKLTVDQFRTLPGGQAATAAVGCARLGWRSRYVGSVGHDEAGRALTNALAREGVDVHVVLRTGVQTRTAFVLVESATGRRCIIGLRDPRLDLEDSDLAESVFAASRVLLVDTTDLTLALRAARLARAAGVRTIIDVDALRPGLAELLQHIDVVIAPGSFIGDMTGRTGVGEGIASLGNDLPVGAVVVATLGADGALAWCRGDEVRALPAVVAAVDTTGAGDAFRAGFASAWLDAGDADPELEDLLATACLVGALNCRDFGAQSALPTRAELAAAAGRLV